MKTLRGFCLIVVFSFSCVIVFAQTQWVEYEGIKYEAGPAKAQTWAEAVKTCQAKNLLLPESSGLMLAALEKTELMNPAGKYWTREENAVLPEMAVYVIATETETGTYSANKTEKLYVRCVSDTSSGIAPTPDVPTCQVLSQENYAKIQKGMTPEAVKKIICLEPKSKDKKEGNDYWTYADVAGNTVVLEFDASQKVKGMSRMGVPQ